MRKKLLGLTLACVMIAGMGCGKAKTQNAGDAAAENTASSTAEMVVESKAETESADLSAKTADESGDTAASGKGSYKLEYWTEGSPVVESIESYVADVTDPNSEHFIPVEDRIATFDLDGTIIGELSPSYFEYMMFIHRALYDESYEAPEDMKEFAQALEQGIATKEMPEGAELKHATFAGQAYKGMTVEEEKQYVREFMKSEADGFTNLTRGEEFYLPMVSMVKYLDDNDFQCYIVSGSDRTIVRALIEDWLPIPENRCIGMSYTMVATNQGDEDGLEYTYTENDEVILDGELIIKTIKMNKVSEIELEIGKTPVLSFGNTSGDYSMNQYAVNNDKYESKAFMVLCDDLEREHGNMEKADSVKQYSEEHGFETISMRDDFAMIYGKDYQVVPYSFEAAADQSTAAAAESAVGTGTGAEAEGAGQTESAAAESAAEADASTATESAVQTDSSVATESQVAEEFDEEALAPAA